ncbi:unnamed protein product [Staurois parvus]|uniref:Uncharacterized protein n=1 Tax=Staurois parvus TaxID=386267 RepID=A0ABN9GFL8_9NEOB|nr:unnamed protein product [Staurois parvus]
MYVSSAVSVSPDMWPWMTEAKPAASYPRIAPN